MRDPVRATEPCGRCEGAWMRRLRQKVRALAVGIAAVALVGLVQEELLGYLLLIGAAAWLIGRILSERDGMDGRMWDECQK